MNSWLAAIHDIASVVLKELNKNIPYLAAKRVTYETIEIEKLFKRAKKKNVKLLHLVI